MLDRRAFAQLLLAGALAPVALAACGAPAAPEAEQQETAPEEEPMAGMANPFIDCSSAAEVAKVAGFEVTFPESVPGYAERFYQAVEGQMAQCFYHNGEDGPRVLVRKGVDDGSGDLSGDYGEYSEVKTVDVGGFQLTERGEDGLVHVAIWERDGYLFAIDADEGLEPEVVENLAVATL